jgi:hypothetical protein
MSGLFQKLRFRRGAEATRVVTVPPMDGALKPNQFLDDAQVLARQERPDNLARDEDRLLFSSGPNLNALKMGAAAESATEIARFDSEIAALASDGAGGYAIGLDNGEIRFGGALCGVRLIKPDAPIAPTALAFGASGQLYICSGSATNRPSDWKRDLVERNASGSVWSFDLSSGRGACLAAGLAFPYGIAPTEPKEQRTKDRSRRPAGLSRENRGGARRLLVGDIRAARATNRVRLARKRISAADDGDDRAGVLDGSRPLVREKLSRAAATRGHQDDGRAQGLGADPLVWPSRPSRRSLSADGQRA